jgi:hypothetical protein
VALGQRLGEDDAVLLRHVLGPEDVHPLEELAVLHVLGQVVLRVARLALGVDVGDEDPEVVEGGEGLVVAQTLFGKQADLDPRLLVVIRRKSGSCADLPSPRGWRCR